MRHPGLGQAHPVGGAQGDQLVVEVVVRVVQRAGAGIVAATRVGAAVRARAVGDEAVGARLGLQHVGEVLGAHGGLLLGRVVRAHDLAHHLAAERGFVGAVDGGRVVAVEVELAARAHGGAHAFGDFLHALLDQVEHLEGEGAHRALDLARIGDHVGGFAGVDHGDGDHARVHRLLVAREDGLEGLHDLAGDGHRVAAHVRQRRVAALAADGDPELVAGGHHRAGADGEGAHLRAGPVVHAEHGFHGELLEQAVLDHLARAAAAFFGRLEDQVDGAVEVAVLGEVQRRGHQHGGVAVVPAGVHLAVVLAGVLEGVELGHRQRVHVGAQADGAAALAAVAPVHDAHHAGGAHAAVHGDAPFRQLFRHQVGGALFLEAEFGMRVDVAPQLGDGRGLRQDGFDQVHGHSLALAGLDCMRRAADGGRACLSVTRCYRFRCDGGGR